MVATPFQCQRQQYSPNGLPGATVYEANEVQTHVCNIWTTPPMRLCLLTVQSCIPSATSMIMRTIPYVANITRVRYGEPRNHQLNHRTSGAAHAPAFHTPSSCLSCETSALSAATSLCDAASWVDVAAPARALQRRGQCMLQSVSARHRAQLHKQCE